VDDADRELVRRLIELMEKFEPLLARAAALLERYEKRIPPVVSAWGERRAARRG
jgi:hypothetical protein